MTKAGKAVADYLTKNQITAETPSAAADEGNDPGESETEMTPPVQPGTGENMPDAGSTGFAYRSEDLLEQAQKLQEMSTATNRQLVWIASISLLVGGIGVMNIMLVSVTERIGEIGLKKALGAKRKRILTQFLTEAAVLTSIGGVAGVLLGILLAQIVSRTNGIPVAISVPAIAIAVGFSIVIGIAFGFLPAVKAANLSPIEALRRD